MAETCAKAAVAGIEGIAFGDLFLEDVRAYREKQTRNTGLQPVFPSISANLRGSKARQLLLPTK